MNLENIGVLLQMSLEHVDLWKRIALIDSMFNSICLLISIVTFFLLVYRVLSMDKHKENEIEKLRSRVNEEFQEKNNLYRELKKLQGDKEANK